MNKFFLTLTIAAFIVTSSQAQVGFRLGLKGGVNLSNIDRDISTDNRTGYHVGAFATLKITKFAIQPEVLFSSQGAINNVFNQELESTFNYVNVPVLLKFYIVKGLHIYAGPQIGFLTGGTQEVTDLNGNITEADPEDFISNNDFSLAFGAGWDLPFKLTVEARYNLGLSDINDIAGASEVNSRVFQISLGYRLIGK